VKYHAAVLIGLTLYSFVADCPRARSALSPVEALNYERVGDLHFSPDGRKLAYIALSYPKDWLPRVCIVDISSGAPREITPANKSERSPEWSPDGKTLAFLSNRGGKVQVYAISAAGGGSPSR
jgi:Tol biopolymer transport system component